MKKKLLIATISVILLFTILLVGCTPAIDVSNPTSIKTNVIDVLQEAIANSVASPTYYIKEKYIEGDPKDIANSKMIEYKYNYKADDKSINGVNNIQAKLEVVHTTGIESYADTFTFGQSLKSDIKAKVANAGDYKAYAFSEYKKLETAPKHTKEVIEYDVNKINEFVTSNGLKIADYTMASVLAPLKELTADDIKFDNDTKSGNYKKGKVSYYAFKVVKEGHEYFNKGVIKVQVFEGKIMRVMTADEKYVLDTMYQGPNIYIPNFDTFTESGVEINVISDRSDGMIALYKEENFASDIILVNPKDLKLKLVESAVNWNTTFTEVIYENEHYFILTKNIVNDTFDINSMIPMIALVVAGIALIVALIIMFKMNKKIKLLKKDIKKLQGEDEDIEETNDNTDNQNETEGKANETQAETTSADSAEQTEVNAEEVIAEENKD